MRQAERDTLDTSPGGDQPVFPRGADGSLAPPPERAKIRGHMGRARLSARSAAVTILFVAAFEVFACGLCSGDTCALQGTFSHQSHQATSSGDECLCCCGHLLIAPPIHVEPVSLVTPAPDPEPRQATIERQTPVYHPPRALAV